MAKYHNQVVNTSDGITHASKREATRWTELKLLEKAGKISNLKRQVKYELIPAQYEKCLEIDQKGKFKRILIERECAYIADFEYLDQHGNKVVEDTKGVRTKDYIIKRKLMLYKHGIRIREV